MTAHAGAPLSTSPARSLAELLRQRHRRQQLELLIAEVSSTPDSKHVRIELFGSLVTVPRLASYTSPVVGEACYLLAQGSIVLAIGAVR